jgi:Raf kinase inhibitor-like YbhB/YbcL family protein
MNMKKISLICLGCIFSLVFFNNCKKAPGCIMEPAHFVLYTNSFKDTISFKYSCGSSQQFHPQLWWSGMGGNPDGNPPPGSFVMIMDDPDAIPVAGYIWNHWVLYDIPGNVSEIEEGVDRLGVFPAIVKRGINSFGDTTYGGPCPPPGTTHRYRFKLYAMKNSELGIGRAATVAQIRAAMASNILDSAEMTAVFKR